MSPCSKIFFEIAELRKISFGTSKVIVTMHGGIIGDRCEEQFVDRTHD